MTVRELPNARIFVSNGSFPTNNTAGTTTCVVPAAPFRSPSIALAHHLKIGLRIPANRTLFRSRAVFIGRKENMH